MHGAPGAGKSSFIKELGLEYLTISHDNLRLLFSAPESLVVDNHACLQISQKNNKKVWKLVFEFLESRMRNGSDTILDACNFAQDFIAKYTTLAKRYDFRVIALDFSSIPLDVLLKQNEQRLRYDAGLRYVPEHLLSDVPGIQPPLLSNQCPTAQHADLRRREYALRLGQRCHDAPGWCHH